MVYRCRAVEVLEGGLESLIRPEAHPRTGDRVGPLETCRVIRGCTESRGLMRGDATVAEVEEIEDLG
jgi:hypothetical protein